MDAEVWKPVLEWPHYEISDLGNVRSRRGAVKSFVVQDYLQFNVSDSGGRRRALKVHREVIRAHVGDRPGMIVRHLDGNPLNANLSNLAWGTHKENELDKIAHGTKMLGEKHHQCKLTVEQVKEIRSSTGQTGILAEKFGVTRGTICSIRRGKTWGMLPC